jgi:membrane protease subunit (stomatin/prohibitin family)
MQMGLMKAAIGAAGGVLADQWKEYIYCDAMDADTLVKKGVKRTDSRSSNTKGSDNVITNGSKVAVNEGQCMLVVENGKVVDFTTEAGAYTYDTGTEPSLFDGGWQGLKESFSKVGKRFTYGGQAENDQRVYFVNTKEIMNNKIGIGDVPFRDSEFGFTVKIQGYGNYSYKITDPIMFYTNVCANVADSFKRAAIDEQLKTEVQAAMQPALGAVALKGIAYDSLPMYTKEIGKAVNDELSNEWTQLRGISVVSVAFASITVDSESAKKISEFQESRIYTNTQMLGARLGTAQANAMEKAAANEGGAMKGFMGMGMAMNAGGSNAAQMFNMANQQPQQPIPQQPTPQQPTPQKSENSWVCECGKENTGKFCSECGKPQPKPETKFESWVCECGKENTGKFCSECGKPKPQSENWVCECGKENTGKFCSECGKSRE